MDIFYANSGSHLSPSVSGAYIGAGAKHPGDYADAQRIIDWEKALRAEFKASSTSPRCSPAAFRRPSNGLVSLEASVGRGVTF